MNQRLGMMGFGVAALSVLSGCASPDHDLRAWLRRDPQSWQLSEGSTVYRADTLAATMPGSTDGSLPDEVGADDLVRVALRNNPSILSAAAKVRRLDARIAQVTSLDDPQLEISPFGEMAETAAGMVGLMTGLSQRLPFPGKLDTMGRIAEQDVRVAREDLRQVMLDIATQTREAFYNYQYASKAIEVTGQSRALLEQMQGAAQSLYETNRATQQDVLRLVVELAKLDNELLVLHQDQQASAAMLNNLMARPIDAAIPSLRDQTPLATTLTLDELLVMAAESNPTIRQADDRIETERQRLRLAKLQRFPDVTVALTYNLVDDHGMSPMSNGKDQWGVGFMLNLPIWFDKLRAGEREAYAGMQEQIAELTAVRNRVAYEVRDASIKVDTRRRLVELFRDRIIPQARRTVDVSSGEYRAGRIGALALIDNWRNLLSYELLYAQSLADLGKEMAQLERAVGRPLAHAAPSTVPSTMPKAPEQLESSTEPSGSF